MAGTATVTDNIRRTYLGTAQSGTVERDISVYPDQSPAHLSAINNSQFDITLSNGTVLPGIGSGGGSGPALPSSSRIIGGNPDVFNPQIQWLNGRARLIDQASIGTKNYCVSGSSSEVSLSTEYTYLPGDEVTIYVYQPSGGNEYNRKGSAVIVFGPAGT